MSLVLNLPFSGPPDRRQISESNDKSSCMYGASKQQCFPVQMVFSREDDIRNPEQNVQIESHADYESYNSTYNPINHAPRVQLNSQNYDSI